MFTLRCTQRLLARLRVVPQAVAEPTTMLGDWYAYLVQVGRLQLVLCVSERTFLPVLVPAAPISTLAPRIRIALGEVLSRLGVSREAIAKEDAEMVDVAYGKTANRQVIGVMVDFAKAVGFYLDDTPSLLDVSLLLAETPCSPLYDTTVSPDSATIALFTATPLRLVQ